jgi:hypothetical protein
MGKSKIFGQPIDFFFWSTHTIFCVCGPSKIFVEILNFFLIF